MKFCGYHGTDIESADKIDSTFFIDSDSDAWLGSGVYFFENVENYFDAYQAALNWSRVVKKNIYAVIYKADIISDKVFDLLNKEYQDKFIKLKIELKNKHIESGLPLEEFSESDVFRQIIRKFEVIRAVVDGKHYSDEFPQSYVTIIPQVQICVCKNSTRVISNIKRIDVD